MLEGMVELKPLLYEININNEGAWIAMESGTISFEDVKDEFYTYCKISGTPLNEQSKNKRYQD